MKQSMLSKIQLTTKQLIQFSNFDFHEQLRKLQKQYAFKVSFRYSINLQNINQVIQFIRKSFIYFVNLRFKHLLIQPDQELLEKNHRQLKEEYINLYLNYKYHKDSAINLLTVIAGLIIFNLIKSLWPDIQLNQKIKYDIIHVIIHCTLGILMSDASIKLTLSKYLSDKIQQNILNKKDINQGSIKRRITNNQQTDIKSLLLSELENQLRIQRCNNNTPLPAIQKIKIDTYQYDQSQKQYRNKPFKKLKKLRFYSNQISPAMMTKTQNQQSFLPHVKSSLISYTPQIHGHIKKNNIEKYKELENTAPIIETNETTIKLNKKTITYWKKQIDRLKQAYSYKSKFASQQSSEQNQQEVKNIDLPQKSKINKQLFQSEQISNEKVKPLDSVPIVYKKYPKRISVDINLSVETPQKQIKKQIKQKSSHKQKITILKHNKNNFQKSCIYNKPIQQLNSILLKYKQKN